MTTPPAARPGRGWGSGAGPVAVSATDDSCELSSTELPAGTSTLAITNEGSQVTEVYVYGEGDRIVTEKENIRPGISYDLTVDLQPGAYEIACKPGLTGDGIRTTITVGDDSGTATADPASDEAVADYRGWVEAQAAELVPLVEEFTAAVEAGDVAEAKALYASSRATGKITGEEEAFSHTDLVDFAANVEGARQAFASLRPLVEANDPQLVATLEREFAEVETALAAYRTGPAQDYAHVSYDTVGTEQRKELARVVDALGEPLSGLAAAAAG